MRDVGLAVAGMIALTAPVAGHAATPASSMKPLAPGNGIIRVWGGCGWGWHPVPAIGASRGVNGSPRIARLTAIMVDGVPTALGKAPTEIGAPTDRRGPY